MARILILHALLGNGHRSAAEALAAAIERAGAQAQVEDALDHVHPLVSRLWKAAYSRMSESAPRLYRAIYAASDADDLKAGAASALWAGRLSRIFLANLDRLIARARPDAVVCTMQFPLQLMSHMAHRGALRVPLSVVVTDYVPHGSWVAAGVSRYFVASEPTADGFARKGVPRSLVRVTGVPISAEVARPKPVTAIRAHYGLPVDRPVICLFGGGIDPARVRTLAAQLLAGPMPATLVIVAGRSWGLEAALQDVEPGPRVGLARFGAVEFVDDLVAAGDLVITKPGGLITSEVLARGRPMLLTAPIPGQEEWNADFVCAAGAGVQISTPEAVPPVAFDLLAQPERLAMMAAQARRVGRPHAARDVAAAVCGDLHGAVLAAA